MMKSQKKTIFKMQLAITIIRYFTHNTHRLSTYVMFPNALAIGVENPRIMLTL